MRKKIKSLFLSMKMYMAIFLVIATISTCQMLIYFAFIDEGIQSTYVVTHLIISYLVFMSFLTGLIIIGIRYFSYEKPMRRLSEAIERVAQGDFSVRIKPMKTNKKDNFISTTYEDFNKMVEELNSIETLKDDFIANVSHEIKTPLSVIQSYALALTSDDLTPLERKEYTQTIITATQKQADLVVNILKLNKLENQEIVATPTSFSLSEQLRFCSLTYEDLWEKKNITFYADLEEIDIVADEGMLEIAWNNLISNAIKYTPEGGSVSLVLKREGKVAKVEVVDTGCGMKEETIHHIFDKFYQGDTSHSQSGNGLGLALVNKVVKLSSGTISVSSMIGEGSTFSVTLPIKEL